MRKFRLNPAIPPKEQSRRARLLGEGFYKYENGFASRETSADKFEIGVIEIYAAAIVATVVSEDCETTAFLGARLS